MFENCKHYTELLCLHIFWGKKIRSIYRHCHFKLRSKSSTHYSKLNKMHEQTIDGFEMPSTSSSPSSSRSPFFRPRRPLKRLTNGKHHQQNVFFCYFFSIRKSLNGNKLAGCSIVIFVLQYEELVQIRLQLFQAIFSQISTDSIRVSIVQIFRHAIMILCYFPIL